MTFPSIENPLVWCFSLKNTVLFLEEIMEEQKIIKEPATIITYCGDTLLLKDIAGYSFNCGNNVLIGHIWAEMKTGDRCVIKPYIQASDFEEYLKHIKSSISAMNSFNAKLYDFEKSTKSRDWKKHEKN